MLNKRQIADSNKCEESISKNEDMDCTECSCSVCIAQIPKNVDHTVICNSLGCDYNNGKSVCVVVAIEIRDGHCESFSEKRKWQLNLENS